MFSLSRYRKQIMSVLMALVMAGSICFFEPMTVNAQVTQTGYEFYLNYARPMVSDNSGYINILLSDYTVITYFWNINCSMSDGSVSPASAYIDLTSNSLTFGPLVDLDDYETVNYNFYAINKYGIQYMLKTSDSSNVKRTFSNSIIGWKAYGDVVVNDESGGRTLFTVYYAEDGSSLLLMEVIDLLRWTYDLNVDIYNVAHSILNSVDGLENQLTSVINYLKSVDDKLPDIQDELQNIYDKLDEILEEEKKQTSWLEKIWNSIQEFFSASTEDQEVTDSLKENSQSQSNQLNDLNEQSKVEKVDPDSASASVDSYIDTAAVGTYGTVLSTFTGNNRVLQYLLIVFAVAFIGYVLFGKR